MQHTAEMESTPSFRVPLDVTWRSRLGIFIAFSDRLSNKVKVKELQGTLCWKTEKEPTFSEESSSKGGFVSLRLCCTQQGHGLSERARTVTSVANKRLMDTK